MNWARVLFYRRDLFTVCRVGFMANRIGPLWCEGWILEDRLDQLTHKNIWFTTDLDGVKQ
jgi:hypothetical protein